jgi:hypothetical protein
MRKLLIWATAAALLAPGLATTAEARPYGYYGGGSHYYGNSVRREQRECQRELRRADSRREYRRELRECRREIARARHNQRDWRRDRWHDRHDNWRDDRRYGYRGW